MRSARRLSLAISFYFCVCNPGFGSEAGGSVHTFTNPVVATGADPWVIRFQADYYLCQSRSNEIRVNRSARLEDIGQNHWVSVWKPPKETLYSKELWAPELRLLQGKWYIYLAADDGRNSNHRMYVYWRKTFRLTPQGAFSFKGKISAPTDRWAIDGTVLEMPDKKLYFVWSGWEGTNDVAQNIYIAPMANPWTISGERVCISRPEFDWGEPRTACNQ